MSATTVIYDTLIEPRELLRKLDDPDWAVFDCRHSLADPSAGERAYGEGHIPGACYIHLDRDLSGPATTDQGRHPLPPPDVIRKRFSALGIDNDHQIIAYDDSGGMTSSRLWWMLRYMGHERVAVLNGGWQAWERANFPTEITVCRRGETNFKGEPRREWLVTVDEVPSATRLIDSRDAARYRGEVEPIDRVAGHIPGAGNRPYPSNLDEDGRFRTPKTLERELTAALNGADAEETVFYCGSGVSACHNLLALAHAGMPSAKLYVGSWSEWSSDEGRPVATGTED